MKQFLLTDVLLLLLFCCGCSRTATSQDAKPTVKPAESQVARTDDKHDKELQTQIAQITTAAKGRVGVAAVLLETGDSVSLDPTGHFPMQSVYKLPIGMAVMNQVDAGKIRLDQKVRIAKEEFIGRTHHSPIRDRYPNGIELSVNDLLRWMLKESDGTASDMLMALAGGPSVIQAYLTEIKITDMIVLDTEKAFSQDSSAQYRNWATPEAAVALLRTLHERRGLSESSQSLLMKLMIESSPGRNRLKGLLPPGTIVAHKTGTSGTESGVTAATNDIGIISLPNGRHMAIAVFVANSPGDEKTREAVIARVAKVVYDKWSKS